MYYNAKGYAQIVNERYIAENKENSKVVEFKDIKDELESYFYDELNDKEVKGYPCASAFENSEGKILNYDEYSKLSDEEKKNHRLKYYYQSKMHELYIGSTGSGKTTGCIEPQLRAISCQKNKPNLFITDPKGEIFEHNAKHLKDNGYNIQVINLKNTQYSNIYSPLSEIYDLKIKWNEFGKKYKKVKGSSFSKNLIPFSKTEDFTHDYYLVYDGYAFASESDFKEFVGIKKAEIESIMSEKISNFAYVIFPREDEIGDSINWICGARDIFEGVIYGLLDQTEDPNKNFTKEVFNFKTLYDFYNAATNSSDYKNDLQKNIERTLSSKAKEKFGAILHNASEKTVGSYKAEFMNYFSNWNKFKYNSIMYGTNIEFDDSKSPIAYFIITKDYSKNDNKFVGMLVNAIYEHFVERADNTERKNGVCNTRDFHFLLDEFANIPPIKDFENKISTSRSRNIWFHLILQSYEQLYSVYGDLNAETIINNCNQQTFLGSQSVEAKKRFAKECGYKTITRNYNSNLISETISVLNQSILDLDTNYIYTKRNHSNVMKCFFIRNYECAQENIFKDFTGYDYTKYFPKNWYNPYNEKYCFDLSIFTSSKRIFGDIDSF